MSSYMALLVRVYNQGNFSEGDRQNWTPELKRSLNFDQTQALQVDNGTVMWQC